ncbi:hypothetical protein [Bacillus mycoides]|uniref:hypothetical protein n=1 Tax=Bacillus mycoides TaxID=1405 RepID=UPI002931B02E|nr:hypothetical protein [Bacillus mycoides]WOA60662.1 hypothetical protein RVY74_30495 [Bacillus mycoides]
MYNFISIEEKLKNSRTFAIKKTLINYAINFFILLTCLIICREFIDPTRIYISANFNFILSMCLFLLIYPAYKFYRRLYNILTIADIINDIVQTETKPKLSLKSSLLSLEQRCNVIRIKIDILKSISPIPIFVFFLGMAFDKSTYQEYILGVSLLLMMLYIYWIKYCYELYDTTTYNVSQFKIAISDLEEK